MAETPDDRWLARIRAEHPGCPNPERHVLGRPEACAACAPGEPREAPRPDPLPCVTPGCLQPRYHVGPCTPRAAAPREAPPNPWELCRHDRLRRECGECIADAPVAAPTAEDPMRTQWKCLRCGMQSDGPESPTILRCDGCGGDMQKLAPAPAAETPRDPAMDRLYRAHMAAAASIAEFGVPDQEKEEAVDLAWDALFARAPAAETPPVDLDAVQMERGPVQSLHEACDAKLREAEALLAAARRERDALAHLLSMVTLEEMGGTPDLFAPVGGWETWDEAAREALAARKEPTDG